MKKRRGVMFTTMDAILNLNEYRYKTFHSHNISIHQNFGSII